MKSLNKAFFWVLIFIALTPFIIGLAMASSPLWIVLLFIFGVSGFRFFKRLVGSFLGGLTGLIVGLLESVFKCMFAVFGFLFGGLSFLSNKPSSAQFLGWWGRYWLLRSGHKGMLVDGRSARLSETATFQSLLVQGGMGMGKTSIYVISNLLSLSATKPSFVVTDTSGEIFKATSGYLKRQGYKVRVLNLMDADHSETYNPLAKAKTPQQIAEVASALVKASRGQNQSSSNDPFWEQAAEKLIRILIQCLVNNAQLHPTNAQYLNLANLRHLILNFDAHTAPKGQLGRIDQFVLSATRNDPSTFAAYQAFVQGNQKVIQSVLMSADVALDALASPEVAKITANSSINFDELRSGRTVLYVMINQTQMSFYSFLLNLFYTELFGFLLSDLNKIKQPVWLFLDEFGHLSLPDFSVFASTARKYRVAFALFVQSLSQLETRYGHSEMKTIMEAIGTEIYLPGVGLDIAQKLESRLGRKVDSKGHQYPLLAANDIIRMDPDQALMLHSNELPVLLKTKPYYKRSVLRQRASIVTSVLPQNNAGSPNLFPL